jgi:hypothetical protein
VRGRVLTMTTKVADSRLAFGVCVAVTVAVVADVVFIAAFTSWWLLFALVGVLPLLMMVCGARFVRTGGSFARRCAELPSMPWFGNNSGPATRAH